MPLVIYSPDDANVNGTTSGGSAVERAAKRRRLNTNSADYVISSRIEEEQFSFEWKLKGYSALSSRLPEIRSPILVGGPKSKHNWQMKLIPKRLVREKEYTSVHLILISFGDDNNDPESPARQIQGRFQLRVLNAAGFPVIEVGEYCNDTN
ncbi:unnamed protein product [Orchesella dallaii]|uniref:MATH domain-containing protein n=1 Tax=Orchesella dallaii TaxID=48710 RepID=A0ABP1R3S8_9HEXA